MQAYRLVQVSMSFSSRDYIVEGHSSDINLLQKDLKQVVSMLILGNSSVSYQLPLRNVGIFHFGEIYNVVDAHSDMEEEQSLGRGFEDVGECF